MDLISSYSDEGANKDVFGAATAPLSAVALPAAIDAAPSVDTSGLALVENRAVPLDQAQYLQSTTARNVRYNLPASQLYAPVAGPSNPADRGGMSATERNHWAGRAENAHLSSYAFDEEYHTFQATGRAMDPGVSGREVAAKDDNAQGDTQHVGGPHKRQRTTESRSKESIHPSRSVDPSAPFTLRTRQPWAEKASLPVQLTEEQAEAAAAIAEERAEKAAVQGRGEHSIFHGGAERDYQGRSWLEVPVGAHRAAAEASFLPKRHLHTWSGHTKGVNAVRFFPRTGHLLLSAGLDGKIKVWDTAGDRRCMRTYLGHTKGVRDAWFSADGRRFVSAAYDKTIKVWDTETGAVLAKLGDGQMAYCVRTHPDPGQDDVLLAGMQSRKILQFDMRTADVVQEYDYHLSAVNTVTFVDENRRFISTSDDKTIRVWELGIPVQVKYIADPSLHAISAAALSNSGKWWVGQSADNQVLTYTGDDRTRPMRKKTFRGHSSAGYACQLGFSPDDRYVLSGDGDGKVFIWDWKSTKVARSLKAHEGVCIGVAWHPLEASRVATCGWDGAVKLWD